MLILKFLEYLFTLVNFGQEKLRKLRSLYSELKFCYDCFPCMHKYFISAVELFVKAMLIA